MTHNLKIKYEFAKLHFIGKKNWELRKNDRDFKIGDTIQFKIIEFENSSDWSYERIITNVFDDTSLGLKDGYVILSIEKTL
jgi:DNA-directed RNA polymerase subunit E'/Rpb7